MAEEARVAMVRLLTLIEQDMHERSPRPCATCQQVSDALGRPWGCLVSLHHEAERRKSLEAQRQKAREKQP